MTIKLTRIDGGQKPDKVAEAVRSMRGNLTHLLEYLAIDAQLRRKKYESLLSQGFTDAQALELCKGPTL